ncbi:MAG: ATP-binding protein [Helicobacteraceae bacterium]|jgi:predicted AAA+ superfamily ATPase|nr:ATP-binding protein [Helicobacteraceae bacterium]
MIDWRLASAAIWRETGFKAVKRLDPIALGDLFGLDRQKELLLNNTRQFLSAKPCNHALLWGQRGCGKSSLIKAVFNELRSEGLRLIEVDRDDLAKLPQIADLIENEPFRFILFCDDLSFENDERGYKGLKRILEGSIELPPENVKIYATSNRRHLVSESLSDNVGAIAQSGGELHYADVVEEKLSLSDRFGLTLSFYGGGEDEYLAMIDDYFKDFKGDRAALTLEAKRFAQLRASRSARVAKQFIGYYETALLNSQDTT